MENSNITKEKEANIFINPYELFQINEESSIKDLKKSYYNLCLLAHPDKGGNLKDMQIVQNAYIFLKKQMVENTKEELIELMKNANYDFEEYYTQFRIEKIPSLLDITHGEYLETFNKLFDSSYNSKISYDKLGYNTEKSKISIYDKNIKVENIDYNDILKNELGEEYIENISKLNISNTNNNDDNINIDDNDNNINIKMDVNTMYNNIFNNNIYTSTEKHETQTEQDGTEKDTNKQKENNSLILAQNSFSNYSCYNFDIERDLAKYKYEDLCNFSKNKELINNLNIDFGSSNYSDYNKAWENNDMFDIINSREQFEKTIHENIEEKYEELMNTNYKK